MEVGEELGGLDVGGVFGVEGAGLVAGDEGEPLDVAVEVGEGEAHRGVGGEVVEACRVFGVEVVDGEGGEVGGDDVAGGFVFAAVVDEVGDVADGLGVGAVEVLAAGFVFADESARPEDVDAVGGAGEGLDGFLEGGDGAAGLAEDLEELVPEGLGFGAFAGGVGGVGPVAGEGDGALADLVPGEGHGTDGKGWGVGEGSEAGGGEGG